MNPTIEVEVDISNPGQVFACCGIFELAHRMTTGQRRAMGWFDEIDKVHTKFIVEAYDQNDAPVTLNDILKKLKVCEITELEYNDKEGPVIIGEPFNFIIDWRKPYPQNGSVKTWAAQQKISSILMALIDVLPDDSNIVGPLFEYSTLVKKAVTSFDALNAENRIDVGFSFDKLKKAGLEYSLPVFLFTELFALIGLQRFNPISSTTEKSSINRYQRVYYLWNEPLDIINASSTITVPNVGVNTNRYSFTLYLRDSGGRYKSFALAKKKYKEVEI